MCMYNEYGTITEPTAVRIRDFLYVLSSNVYSCYTRARHRITILSLFFFPSFFFEIYNRGMREISYIDGVR